MKKLLIAFVVVVVLIGALVLRTFYFAGEFKVINPHYNGVCTALPGILGPEDVTIDRNTGLAYVSSYDRKLFRSGQKTQGAIWGVDFKAKNPVPKNLTAGFKKEFHPHGISLYHDPDGKTFLFAINHRTKEDSFVEIFEYVGGVFEHRQSVSHPLMWEPNDLLAVGPRSFYVSNNHGNRSSFGRILEDFIPIKRSYVLYYDGKEMTYAAKSIGGANGIAMSTDGKTVYIAATTGQELHVYDRDTVSGKLNPSFDIDLGTRPDNIELDDAGSLYIACLPKGLSYMAHSKGIKKRAPSQVLKITIAGKADYKVSEVFLDDGERVSGATVGAPFPGGMILGHSRDKRNHILICTDGTSAQGSH